MNRADFLINPWLVTRTVRSREGVFVPDVIRCETESEARQTAARLAQEFGVSFTVYAPVARFRFGISVEEVGEYDGVGQDKHDEDRPF